MLDYNPRISFEVNGDSVQVKRPTNSKPDRALHGTYRSLVANMVTGVTEGFSKKLDIHGVGYRAKVECRKLTLYIGKSFPVEIGIPEGIDMSVEKNTLITIKIHITFYYVLICKFVLGKHPHQNVEVISHKAKS